MGSAMVGTDGTAAIRNKGWSGQYDVSDASRGQSYARHLLSLYHDPELSMAEQAVCILTRPE
jgi:hypothetical protein